MKEFTIDEEYLTSVSVRTEKTMLENPSNPTNEDLIKILKGWDKIVTIGTKDHDEFTKLREYLGENGYIRIERGWWNGDRVLKPFKLNGFNFKKGDKFASAGAMGGSIKCAKKFGWKKLV